MFKLRDGSKVRDKRLARIYQYDPRNKKFLIKRLIKATEPRSYTWRCNLVLDQGNDGSCVGCGITAELAARPAEVQKLNYRFAKEKIYWEAQRNDEWAGGSYPGACVDTETMALSKSKGWVTYDQLAVGDKILSFDIEKQANTWADVLAINVNEMPYRVWKNQEVEIAVTDNHKWVVRAQESKEPYKLVSTLDLKNRCAIPRSAYYLDASAIPEYDDDIVELVAWAITEGHYRSKWRRGNGIVISQKSHKGRVALLMQRLGVARGFEKTDGCHVWELSGELAATVRKIAPERIPSTDWLTQLTNRQLGLFIDACVMADGHRKPGRKQGYKDQLSFCQLTGGQLESFITACTLYGIPISRQSHNKETDVQTWGLRETKEFLFARLSPSEYITGTVWCPTTTLNTFVARRGRTVWITGNSPVYEGTSVLAGVKVAHGLGYFKGYYWADTFKALQMGVAYHGPAVIGINWYEGMFNMQEDGFIYPTGSVAGGHCCLLTSINMKEEYFTLHNSWGDGWADMGTAKISFKSMRRLLAEEGEAVFFVNRKSKL